MIKVHKKGQEKSTKMSIKKSRKGPQKKWGKSQ